MSCVYLSDILCLSSSLTFCERSFGRLYVFGAVFSTIRIQAYSWPISCFEGPARKADERAPILFLRVTELCDHLHPAYAKLVQSCGNGIASVKGERCCSCRVPTQAPQGAGSGYLQQPPFHKPRQSLRQSCGKGAARLRQGCSKAAAAAILRQACGKAAAHARQGCSNLAARLRHRLQQSCGKAAASSRQGCGEATAHVRQRCGNLAPGLRQGCGTGAASLRQGCGKAAGAVNLRQSCGKGAARGVTRKPPLHHYCQQSRQIQPKQGQQSMLMHLQPSIRLDHGLHEELSCLVG